jgi:succinate dehydrogenase / fumarate reductase cytochrome b subunit
MSAAATTLSRTLKFYEASIGKKVVMAVTGCFLFLFVIGHMLGNLQIYIGADQLNAYGAKLHSLGPILWAIRFVLLGIVVVHITAAVQLWLMNRRARPRGYVKPGWVQASFASRTMIVSGPILAGFITYHILHLTTGHLLPGGRALLEDGYIDVYANVITGFSSWPASLIYIASMVVLGYHLSHGVWSMFQSVGANHPRYMPFIKHFAFWATVIICVGNISIPVSVLLGIVS